MCKQAIWEELEIEKKIINEAKRERWWRRFRKSEVWWERGWEQRIIKYLGTSFTSSGIIEWYFINQLKAVILISNAHWRQAAILISLSWSSENCLSLCKTHVPRLLPYFSINFNPTAAKFDLFLPVLFRSHLALLQRPYAFSASFVLSSPKEQLDCFAFLLRSWALITLEPSL